MGYQCTDYSPEAGAKGAEGCADLAAVETGAKSMGGATPSGNTDSRPRTSADECADRGRFPAAPSGLPVSFQLRNIFSLLRG